MWLSLIGSTEGPPRDVGPPRRSAREVALAIEPALEIVELLSAKFREDAKAWFCLSRKRTNMNLQCLPEPSSPRFHQDANCERQIPQLLSLTLLPNLVPSVPQLVATQFQ